MQRFIKSLGFTFILLLLDQIIKIWIKTHLLLGEEISIIPKWFTIQFVENQGMAFGLEFGGNWGKLALSLFRIIAIGGIGWYLYDLARKKAHFIVLLCISLIFAGATGNMIDSAFYGLVFNGSMHQVAQFMPENGGYESFLHGKVVDMFAFPDILRNNFPLFKPIFNFADACITIGVILILLNWKKFVTEDKKINSEKEAQTTPDK